MSSRSGLACGPPGELVQPFVAASFVGVDVTGRVEDDHPALAPVGVHPQHRLLGHGAAGQEHGGGLAEHQHDLAFQLGHDAALPVAVGLGVRGDRGEQVPGPACAVPAQEPGAGGAQRGEVRGGFPARRARAGRAGGRTAVRAALGDGAPGIGGSGSRGSGSGGSGHGGIIHGGVMRSGHNGHSAGTAGAASRAAGRRYWIMPNPAEDALAASGLPYRLISHGRCAAWPRRRRPAA